MVNNVGQFNGPAYGALKDDLPQNISGVLPQGVQNFDVKETAKNVGGYAENAPVASAAMGTDPKTMGIAAGLFGGFTGLNVWLNNKNFNLPWDKSLFGKIERFGDKIDSLNPLNNSTQGQAIGKRLSSAKTWLSNKFSFLSTPTRNVNKMAISQASGLLGRSANDNIGILIEHITQGGDISKIIPKGLLKSGASKEEAVKLLSSFISDPDKSSSQIRQVADHLANAKSPINFSIKTKFPWPDFLKRKPNNLQIANKLKVALGSTEKSKGFAKFLPKAFGSSLEGVTSGHIGWIGSFAMAAYFFADTVKRTSEAPKGEKLSTFMEGLARNIVPVGFAWLYAKPMNVVGGMKYVGMGKDVATKTAAVDKFREALKNFNEKAASGGFASYKDYRAGRSALNGILKEGSRWWQKPFKAIGNFMSMGQETPNAFKVAKNAGFGQKLASGLSKAGTIFKRKGGGTMRFVVGMFVVGSLISSISSKIVYKIFGKPKKVQEEEDAKKAEKEAKKAARNANNDIGMTQEELVQKLSERPELMQQIQSNPQLLEAISKNPKILVDLLNQTPANTPAQRTTAMSPALQQMMNRGQAQQPQQPPQMQQNQTQQMPAQPAPMVQQQNNGATAATNPQTTQEPQRTYVPSSAPAAKGTSSLTQEQQGKLQDLYSKADRAEAEAMKFLNA